MDINLVTTAAILIATYSLAHYSFEPSLTRKVAFATPAKAPRYAALLSAVGFIKTSAMLLALSAVALAIVIRILQTAGGDSEEVVGVLQSLRDARATLSAIDRNLGLGLLLFLSSALAAMSYLGGRKRAERTLHEARQDALNRLRQKMASGELAELPPTTEIASLSGTLDDRNEALTAALERLEASAEEEGGDRKERLREIVALIQMEASRDFERLQTLDLERRLDDEIQSNLEPLPLPTSTGQRLLTALVSRGTMASIKGVSRVLYILGVILLIPSFVMLASPRIGDAVESRIVHLEEILLASSESQATDSWEALYAQADDGESELSEADEQALDEMARVFEAGHLMEYSQALSLQPVPRPALARTVVRSQILSSTSRRHGGAGLWELRSTNPLAVDQAAARTYADMASRSGPRTQVGQAFRSELRETVATRKPALWARMRAKVETGARSFQIPATHADVRTMLVSEMLGQGTGAIPGDSPLSEMSRRMNQAVDLEARKRAYTIQSRRFLGELGGSGDLRTAFESVAATGSDRQVYPEGQARRASRVAADVPGNSRVAQVHAQYPPTLERVPDADLDMKSANRAMERMATGHGRGRLPGTFGDALAGYDDFMPGQLGQEGRTTRGKLLDRLQSKPTPSHGARTASLSRLRASRSYSRLRGFRRVGGVLIGRPPEEPLVSLDFRGLIWQADGRSLILRFIDAAGDTVGTGPHSPEVVHLALVYAADGRAVAATMTTASPLRDLKVLLHPALVDTRVGCRAIEVDRYVDTYANPSDDGSRTGRQRRLAINDVQGLADLYALVWATRAQHRLSRLEARGLSSISDSTKLAALGVAYAWADRYLSDRSLRENAANALRLASRVDDAALSPLPVKSEYYDQDLVRQMKECAGKIATSEPALPAFLDCAGEGTGSIESDVRFAVLPPTYEEWSGVREQPYRLDAALAFANGERHSVDGLWPFEFMTQVAFTSPPYLIDGDEHWFRRSEDELESYNDESPWEFPSLKPAIQQQLVSALSRSHINRRDLRDLAEFVLLQRLFRVALEGQLGDNFPVERLADLATSTVTSVQVFRTPRWTPHPGYLELGFLDPVWRAYAEARGRQPRRRLGGCLHLAGLEPGDETSILSIDQRSLALISPEAWDAACRFDDWRTDDDEALSRLAAAAAQTSEARRLRLALRVAAASELQANVADDPCGPN